MVVKATDFDQLSELSSELVWHVTIVESAAGEKKMELGSEKKTTATGLQSGVVHLSGRSGLAEVPGPLKWAVHLSGRKLSLKTAYWST